MAKYIVRVPQIGYYKDRVRTITLEVEAESAAKAKRYVAEKGEFIRATQGFKGRFSTKPSEMMAIRMEK